MINAFYWIEINNPPLVSLQIYKFYGFLYACDCDLMLFFSCFFVCVVICVPGTACSVNSLWVLSRSMASHIRPHSRSTLDMGKSLWIRFSFFCCFHSLVICLFAINFSPVLLSACRLPSGTTNAKWNTHTQKNSPKADSHSVIVCKCSDVR